MHPHRDSGSNDVALWTRPADRTIIFGEAAALTLTSASNICWPHRAADFAARLFDAARMWSIARQAQR
jgi:hypothetical protein